MIGVLSRLPYTPPFEMVKVPPAMSSTEMVPSRAFLPKALMAWTWGMPGFRGWYSWGGRYLALLPDLSARCTVRCASLVVQAQGIADTGDHSRPALLSRRLTAQQHSLLAVLRTPWQAAAAWRLVDKLRTTLLKHQQCHRA